MADTPKTQIAQELKRIQDAKTLLGEKATSMGLVFTDEEGGTGVVTAEMPIEQIADAYEDIKLYNQKDAEHTGHSVNGKVVSLKEGYYTQQTMAVQDGGVKTPTVTVDNETGVVTAVVEVTEGYVNGETKSDVVELTAEIDTLAFDNIKSGVKILGVTGAFTSDATVPTTGTGAVLESSHITKDFTAYKNGKMVMGTLENFEGPERFNNFNPLEKADWVLEGPVRIGGSLTVGLSNDLLAALQAI